MVLIFWWMVLVWLAVFFGYWLIRYFVLLKWKRGKKNIAVPIAHSDRLVSLPFYQTALKRYKLLVRLAIGGLTIALAAAVFLSARPARVSVIEPIQQSRDIMLCLDVSGSMLRVDTTLINRFKSLVQNFDGQRIGLVVFNSSSVVLIPLSDDYTFISEQLGKAGTALQVQTGQDFTDITSGTLASFEKGTSLVGDGLVSCMNSLGKNPQKRSQSVILATDNEMNGTPIIALKQAAGLAQQNNIRLYAIDPGQSEAARAKDHTELRSAIESTGGSYFQLNNTNTVSSIVSDISSQEAKYASTAPTVATVDNPAPLLIAATITSLASLVFIWRLRI